MEKDILEAKNIACIRQERELFKQLSFSLTNGELFYIEGANGAGKTSLLKILAGLNMPARGKVTWNSQNIHSSPEIYYQHLGYLGHLAAVKKGLTAKENLKLSQAFTQHNHADYLESILSEVGLKNHINDYAGNLSAGQQRRIALARLLLVPKKLWILDEPFTAIDKQGIQFVERLLKQHIQTGGLAITTSHQALSLTGISIKRLYIGKSCS